MSNHLSEMLFHMPQGWKSIFYSKVYEFYSILDKYQKKTLVTTLESSFESQTKLVYNIFKNHKRFFYRSENDRTPLSPHLVDPIHFQTLPQSCIKKRFVYEKIKKTPYKKQMTRFFRPSPGIPFDVLIKTIRFILYVLFINQKISGADNRIFCETHRNFNNIVLINQLISAWK